MTDLDHALRTASQDWRSELGNAPDLDRLIGDIQIGGLRVGATRWLLAAGTVAAVITIALLYVAGRSSTPRAAAPVPPSGTDTATTSSSAVGGVPWSDTITDPTDTRQLYVMADNNDIRVSIVHCGVASDAVTVTESTTAVRVLVTGHAIALPAGVGCTLDAAPPTKGLARMAVELNRPLGQRRVIDVTTGRSHRVLDAASVPQVHHFPAVCAATLDPTPLTWTEQDSVASRNYFAKDAALCAVQLTAGPIESMHAPTPAHDGVVVCPPTQIGTPPPRVGTATTPTPEPCTSSDGSRPRLAPSKSTSGQRVTSPDNKP